MENAAEETFRNQDTQKISRYAELTSRKNRKESSGSSRPFFAPRFLPSVSHRPPVSAKDSRRPQRAPSEAHFPQEAATALPVIEGRWERDGNHQKKAMKTKTTKTKSAPGLRVQSSNHHQDQTTDSVAPAPVQTPAPAPAEAPAQTPERPPLPRIDYARRQINRELPTDQLLALLRTEAPRFFELAEVVGKWVWIQFTEKQPREVTAALAQLGFHWNNARQTWQHPCGALTHGSPGDPRAKYGTRHAADLQPA